MAMILDAFVGRCVDMLQELATEEVVRVLGVKDDLRRLQEKLDMIKDVLADAERRRIQDKSINRWLSNLRDVMYDADDIIDLCRIRGRQLLEGEVSPLPSASKSVCYPRFPCFSSCLTTVASIPFRHEISKEIEKLNQRLEEISKDRLTFSLPQTSSTNMAVTQVNLRQTSPLLPPDLVGKEAKRAAEGLVESLLNSQGGSIHVFAIVGLGGIGKTTLAQQICNHQKVQAHFAKKLWVWVSKNYSEVGLLKQIIRETDWKQEIHAETKAELQPLVSSALAGNRFLLVLDDVWSADVWQDLLRIPLGHGGAPGSRVLITTRNENVARDMRAIQIHQVQKLSPDDGWALLCKTVCGDGADDDIQELHEIGMQIVEKCDGLPLAIKAVGGVLRTKDISKSEWEKLYRSQAWSVRGELPEAVRGALYLSYEDLPSQLKQCFLYCSQFAKDQTLYRSDFRRLWVAEGFITAPENHLPEDIAEDYYNDLTRRSLLHLDRYIDINGSVCTIHELTRSLALFLTRDESHIVDGNDSTITHSLKFPFAQKNSSKLRRLAMHNMKESETVLNAMQNSQCLRTLLMVSCLQINAEDLFQRFTLLRVLCLSDSMIESIPESIRNLQHLRYLDLDRTTVSQLPESLGCLVNLQFLNLSGCEFLHTLPKSITQLCNLRSLNLCDTPLGHLPNGIGKLDHLTDLDGFVVGEDSYNYRESGTCLHGCGLDELQSMSRLRNLSIVRLERVLTGGIQPLNDKPHLKELRLEWSKDADQSLISEEKEEILEDLSPLPPCVEVLRIYSFRGLKFPLWISMLPNLTSLSLRNCLSCRHLPALGQLQQLKILRIVYAPAVVTIGPEFLDCDMEDGPSHRRTPTAFPKLEELIICSMPNWEEWVCDAKEVADGRRKTIRLLPRLQNLQIDDCPKLRALPDGLQHTAALKQCSIFSAGSIREIKNLLSLEELTIFNCQCLERISNLPALREMVIYNSCRMLKLLEKLDLLQSLSLYLEHDWMECLPEWLLGVVREARTNGTLQTFSLYCCEALWERCIEGGQYWPLLLHIQDISVRVR